MRFNLTLFPTSSHASAQVVIVLAVIGIIYGALVAMVQPDVSAWLPIRPSAIWDLSSLDYSLLLSKACRARFIRC